MRFKENIYHSKWEAYKISRPVHISTTESDIRIPLTKAWNGINMSSIIRRSDIFNRTKRDFFPCCSWVHNDIGMPHINHKKMHVEKSSWTKPKNPTWCLNKSWKQYTKKKNSHCTATHHQSHYIKIYKTRVEQQMKQGKLIRDVLPGLSAHWRIM